MSLSERIMADMKEAMKSKDQVALRSIRAIKSAMMVATTEKGGPKELDDDQELKLLQKLVKQRRDSIAIFEEQGRDDLAATEKEEVAVIERYLPEQMSEDEVRAIVQQIITDTGAESMKDMGKVMGQASHKLAGKADNKLVADIVKSSLS